MKKAARLSVLFSTLLLAVLLLASCGEHEHTLEKTEARAAHTSADDDGDCTTAVACTACDQTAIAAKAAHTPAADDGDCATAVACTACDQTAIAARAAHTPGEDDGDCTTAVTFADAMEDMNEALAAGGYEFRYALNTGADAASHPLILVPAENS